MTELASRPSNIIEVEAHGTTTFSNAPGNCPVNQYAQAFTKAE